MASTGPCTIVVGNLPELVVNLPLEPAPGREPEKCIGQIAIGYDVAAVSRTEDVIRVTLLSRSRYVLSSGEQCDEEHEILLVFCHAGGTWLGETETPEPNGRTT